MKHRFLLILFGLLALTACGDDDPSVDPDPDPVPDNEQTGGEENPSDPSNGNSSGNTSTRPDTAERTVLVYIAAENSLTSFSNSDLKEIKAGMAHVDATKYNLLVYIDNTSTPRLVRLVPDAEGNVTEEVLEEYEEQDSADPEVMKAVYKEAFATCPAQSYGLILWSHGEGWIPYNRTNSRRWWGIDNNSNASSNEGSYMELSELKEALNTTVHFDFILFDACFMESVEVVYELKDCADYFVSSPAEIPGPGMRYDLITPYFFSTEANYVQKIAELYYDTYADNYDPDASNSNSNWTAGVAIGALKSAALPALANATAEVLAKYLTEESGPVYDSVMCYDLRPANLYYHDLKDFIHQQTGADTAAYETWLQAFNEAMVYWGTTPTLYSAFGGHLITMSEYAGGLSMFIPRLTKSDLLPYFHQTAWYSASGWEQTGW